MVFLRIKKKFNSRLCLLTITIVGCRVSSLKNLSLMNVLKTVHGCPRREGDIFKNKFPSRCWRGLTAVALLVGAPALLAQMIDQNHNGMSDVWEWTYNTYGLSPGADTDNDGFSNLQEAIAGTNPFDSNSYPHITVFGQTATNFSVTIPCQLGKIYQLQSVTALGSTNWLMETGLVVRAGSTLTLAAPTGPSAKFFRIGIADTNTDGSQMNDWEKYKLGLDPFNPFSNGNLDGNGQLLSDYAYATNALASQNVFTIAATDPITTQPDPGSSPTDLGMQLPAPETPGE